MPDLLLADIEQAIAQRVDPSLFERCAVDLLQERYYGMLRGTPEKRDMGVDGICGPDANPEFILVVTTGKDFARNLRESVDSYLTEAGPGRAVVLATTREVTMARRAKLQEMLLERGVRLHAVHDRSEFVRLLYGAPQWRKDLLGVTGVAKALSRFPATARPTPPIRLIGRDADLQSLRDTSGDIVLVGKPGVGKTFLLEQLAAEDWCLFDAGWSVADLEDAVREMRPQRIVIDDAHLTVANRIPDLRHLRREMDTNFGIVAVTWPAQAKAVGGALEDATRVDIEELERDQILRVVEEAGVVAPPELQRLIVDQAYGRAGLAVTLARACIAGHADEVATGEALLEDLVGWYQRTLGEASRHTLGALALAGDHGATLQQVREIVGIDGPAASDLIRDMASGGTIDEAPLTLEAFIIGERASGRLRVQPEALRYALVRDVFFGGAGSLDAFGAVEFLDHPSIAAVPIIGARYRGASVSPEKLLPLLDWKDEQAARSYALLGPSEFRTAIDRAGEHRAHIAGAAYRAGVDEGRALEVLMEEAVVADRLEHSTPDHPLRAVSDRLSNGQTRLEARRLAVQTARSSLDRGGDGAVALRVMMHAVNPAIRTSSLDPGLGNTLTVGEGPIPGPWIEELLRLWNEILDVVERDPSLPPRPLLEGLGAWVYPGRIGFGKGPDGETAKAFLNVATRVVERMTQIFGARPGVLRRLNEMVETAGLAVEIKVPDEFLTLFPRRWRRKDELKDWSRRNEEQVELLAKSLVERSNDEIARTMVDADTEALAVGITDRRLLIQLAQKMAADAEEPEAPLAALIERRAPADLVLPFLDRVVELQRAGWKGVLEAALANPGVAGAAIQVALVRPCGDHLKQLAIVGASDWVRVVEHLVFRDEIDDVTMGLLLDAPDQAVRREVAVTLGTEPAAERLEQLAPEMRARCREVIIESPADEMWMPGILERDEQLCSNWLRGWLERCTEGTDEFLVPEVHAAIRRMDAELRVALIGDVPSGSSGPRLKEVLRSLVSDDLAVAEALFDRSDLVHMREAALLNGPSEAWMNRALLALDRGWAPEQIVSAAQYSDPVWTPGGLHWQEKIDALKRLRRPPSAPDHTQHERIIAAGIDFFGKLRDAEVAEARRDRVYGLDSR